MKYFIKKTKDLNNPPIKNFIADDDDKLSRSFLDSNLYCDAKIKYHHAHKTLYNILLPISKTLWKFI